MTTAEDRLGEPWQQLQTDWENHNNSCRQTGRTTTSCWHWENHDNSCTDWENHHKLQTTLPVVIRPNSSSPIPKLKSVRIVSSHQQQACGTPSCPTHQLQTSPGLQSHHWGSTPKPHCLLLACLPGTAPVFIQCLMHAPIAECCPNYWHSHNATFVSKKRTDLENHANSCRQTWRTTTTAAVWHWTLNKT